MLLKEVFFAFYILKDSCKLYSNFDLGAITFDEFRVALFTCDPTNPSRTSGFAPGKSLSPKDILHIFDSDDSGEIGRDEFSGLSFY